MPDSLKEYPPPPPKDAPRFDNWLSRFYALVRDLSIAAPAGSPLSGLAPLLGGGDTNLHYHSADRNRQNHTGTQLAATISDFANAVNAVGGQGNHQALANLPWVNSGHSGTVTTIAGFGASGEPVYISTVPVTNGGTGRATGATAYGLLAAGTTATGAHQTLAAGATTEILVGGGASALPVWTTATGSGAPVRQTAAAVGGTWTASSTWTLPAFTLGGTVTVNGQTISGAVVFNNALSGITTLTASGLATVEEVIVQSASAGADLSGKWPASGSATTATSIFGIAAYGWDGDSLEVAGTINFRATETWSGSVRGSRIQFRVVPNGSTTLTEQLSLEGDGRLHGKAIHNNAGDLTGTTNQYIASGDESTYTATVTAITNCSAPSVARAFFTRLGNIVRVDIWLSLTVTSSGAVEFDVSIPIASNFASTRDVLGYTSFAAVFQNSVTANTTDDRVKVNTSAPSGSQSGLVSFSYEVL